MCVQTGVLRIFTAAGFTYRQAITNLLYIFSITYNHRYIQNSYIGASIYLYQYREAHIYCQIYLVADLGNTEL
jgi:hypothetical protein